MGDALQTHRNAFQRLALRKDLESDSKQLIRPLLNLLDLHQLDFHSTFRILSSFRPSFAGTELESFATRLIPDSLVPSTDARERAKKDWLAWLETYGNRIEEERDEWGAGEGWERAREMEGRKVNPRFVLRQWVLEEVIKKVDDDPEIGKRILAKVLDVRGLLFWSPSALNRVADGVKSV